MNGFVYILQSLNTKRYYIGSTDDIERRLHEHNIGKNKSTKSGIPWEIKFSQTYNTLIEARKIEYKLKKLKSRVIIERIIRDQEITMGR